MEVAINTNIMAPDLAEESAWFKSSYSNDTGGSCVEVADVTRTHSGIAIRDSKIPSGPALLFTPDVFAGFIAEVRAL
ncbi:DUF397 domain-containing protein [Streptomyces sp. NPDC002476]|uniref:DUF397 domain-containing protein n=1 Tax=Streptomyces sp. NPDC002476 TaxID=3364648 RepID=UPI00369A31B4